MLHRALAAAEGWPGKASRAEVIDMHCLAPPWTWKRFAVGLEDQSRADR